jgi:tetratricopeptide (TPR) repeat protein
LVALRRRPEAVPPLNLPAIALLGVGVAAVVEAAFGIQTVVTQAVFWFLGGVLVAVSLAASGPAPEVAEAGAAGAGGAAAAGRSAASRSGSPTGPESGRAEITIRWTGTAAALGIVLGAVLGLLVYGTFLYGSSAPADALPTILIVGVLTWLAGLMLASDCAESGTSCGVASIAVLLLYLAVRWLTLTITKDAAALFTVTVWWLVGCAVLAGILLRAPVPKRTPALRGPLAVLYLALGVIGVALVFVLGIFPVQADIYFQSALANFTAALATTDQTQFEQRFNAADALYDRAILRNRQEPIYPMRWGELYTGLGADIMASPGGDAQQKGQAAAEAFGRAQLYAAQAEQLEPLMPYHAYNRGHVQLIFAQSLPEGQDRTNVADNAASAFQAAFDRVNYDPTLTNEFAVARLLQGRTSEAIALLEYSRDTLDPELPSTHQALAQAYRAAGRTDEALAEAEKAMTLGASGPELLVLLGDLERDRGQTGSALNYYKQAAELSPGNWAVLYNLGLLYKDAGETELAMDALMRSLQMAPDTEADRVQAAVDSLLPSNP